MLRGLRRQAPCTGVLSVAPRFPIVCIRSAARPPSPLLPSVVAVDRACGEAELRGASVFVPGVRACTATLVAGEHVSVVFVDPIVRNEPALGAQLSRGLLDAAADGWIDCGSGIALMGRKDFFPPGQATTRLIHRARRAAMLAVAWPSYSMRHATPHPA